MKIAGAAADAVVTHMCAKSHDGRFVVKRRTDRRRLTRKLNELRAEMWHRMHAPVAVQHRWLCAVVRGHYAYYGLPSNWHCLGGFRDEVHRHWFRVLHRRSQRGLTWPVYAEMLERFPLPSPRITHPRRNVLAA